MDLTQTSSHAAAKTERPASGLPDIEVFDDRPFLRRLTPVDWLFALAMVAGAGFALNRYHPYMDVYDMAVLIGAVPTFVVLG
jgi:hypothetical protein